MVQSNSVHLGRGVLNWNSHERISDRYGSFHIADPEGKKSSLQYFNVEVINQLVSKNAYGSLYAHVIENRKSSHIGDIFRKFKPTIPEIGEQVLLGTGFLFSQTSFNVFSIGLRPTIDRTSDWLIPQALYKCHEQTVDIFFSYENIPLS